MIPSPSPDGLHPDYRGRRARWLRGGSACNRQAPASARWSCRWSCPLPRCRRRTPASPLWCRRPGSSVHSPHSPHCGRGGGDGQRRDWRPGKGDIDATEEMGGEVRGDAVRAVRRGGRWTRLGVGRSSTARTRQQWKIFRRGNFVILPLPWFPRQNLDVQILVGQREYFFTSGIFTGVEFVCMC
jgi:hypothetical protein